MSLSLETMRMLKELCKTKEEVAKSLKKLFPSKYGDDESAMAQAEKIMKMREHSQSEKDSKLYKRTFEELQKAL